MRAICTQCLRPQKTCICDLAIPVFSTVNIVVLQHPNEVAHPKGSVPLLSICLDQVSTYVGELFDVKQLDLVLSDCVLLYPPDVGPQSAPDTKEQSQYIDVSRQHPQRSACMPNKTLLVIDSTWRKSRKMMHLNPWLADLPRIGVSGKTSAYHIRKAEVDGQLSTFESVVYALGDSAAISRAEQDQLIDTFRLFNRRIAAFAPSYSIL